MAALRQVEDRDAKGNTIRVNPAITFKQDRNIRRIVGRNDWALDENPEYHAPITAQVQNGKIYFFEGVPDTTQTRQAAKEIAEEKVPKYILDELRAHPMRVREARPTVYEVKLVTVGDVESAQLSEIPNDGQSVTVTPIAPDISSKGKGALVTPSEATL